jgi:hypothetical protein
MLLVLSETVIELGLALGQDGPALLAVGRLVGGI